MYKPNLDPLNERFVCTMPFRKLWRDKLRDKLTKHMCPDAANLCIQYLFLPAGESCEKTCGTMNLFFLQFVSGTFHHSNCPDAPEQCHHCGTSILTENCKCKFEQCHIMHNWYDTDILTFCDRGEAKRNSVIEKLSDIFQGEIIETVMTILIATPIAIVVSESTRHVLELFRV